MLPLTGRLLCSGKPRILRRALCVVPRATSSSLAYQQHRLHLETAMSVLRREREILERKRTEPLPEREAIAERKRGEEAKERSQSGALAAYQAALHRRPVLTKSLTCFAGSLLGDGLAQLASGSSFDLHRNLSLALYGLLVGGPMGHYWHAYLDGSVMPSKPQCSQAVVTKLAMDQLLMAPVANVLLFAFLELAKGTPEQTLLVVQEKTWGMLCANWMVWPLVQLIAFRYIKQDWRILYANIIGVVWCAYVSLVVFAVK